MAEASDEEKIDSKNGLTLTPTYHRLLDRGFISFDEKGRLLVSPYLTNFNIDRLSLKLEKNTTSLQRGKNILSIIEKIFLRIDF